MKRVLVFLLVCLFAIVLVGGENEVCFDDSDCVNVNPCVGTRCGEEGVCISYSLDVSCDDEDLCTINDRCVNSSCVGTPRDISDGNPLTDDLCLADGTIVHREFIVSGGDDLVANVDNPDSPFGDSSGASNIPASGDGAGASDDDSFGDSSGDEDNGDDGSSWWIWVLVFLVLAAVIGVGSWFWLKYFKSGKKGAAQNVAGPKKGLSGKMVPLRGAIPSRVVPPRRMLPRRMPLGKISPGRNIRR